MTTTSITPAEFRASEGLDDWRVLLRSAHAVFQTGSFARGVDFVERIGRLADAANHHPDVDLRYPSVTVRLTTHDIGGLSSNDVKLAREISVAARELGVSADPSAVQESEIAIDVLDSMAVIPFWEAALGYTVVTGADGDVELRDPQGRGLTVWFQQMEAPRPQRNRIHVDVTVAADVAQARVSDVVDAGGILLTTEFAPSFWVLADPEGNEVCVCTSQSRDT